MTKRILACLLAVVLCMTLLPTTALAYSDEDSEPEATEEVIPLKPRTRMP